MYVIQETHNTMGSFNGPLVEHVQPMYFRYVKMDTRRGCYGIMRVTLTQSVDQAKTWATREAAARNAAKYTTDWRTYVVVEVCDCMTEDLNDGLGERVVTHSLRCPLHPEHQEI